jgi:hypothetical protein
MPENQINGRSVTAIAKDILDGFAVINPQVLKKFSSDNYKDLYRSLRKAQRDIRGQSFPTADILAIRKRNLRLQRLNQAVTVVEFSAKEKRISLV